MTISKRQTTYWELEGPKGTIRIDFLGKLEHHFVLNEPVCFNILEEHPVLLNYQHPWLKLYVSSPSSDPQGDLAEICKLLEAYSSSWRSPMEYLNPYFSSETILRTGFGLLLEAPDPLAMQVSTRLAERGISTNCHPARPAIDGVKALVIGRNFVVASDFRVQET
jgi:hypothetical protein